MLGGAGLEHRLIEVHDLHLARSLDEGLRRRGYRRSTDLVMAHRDGAAPPVPTTRVVELSTRTRVEVASTGWRVERPDYPETVTDQLGARIRTVLGAVDATFLGVRDANGTVVARADLYLRDGVAQVEEVVTDPAAHNRGHASALVTDAVQRARQGGAGLVLLVADADDWPAALYRRLGFAELGTTASYTR